MNRPSRKFRRSAGIATALALVAGSLLGCGAAAQTGAGGDDAALPTVSFGVLRAPAGALAVVTEDNGGYTDAGVNVEFTSFAEGGGAAMITAMAGGTPEIGLMSMAAAMQAIAQGTFDVQIVSIPGDPVGALPILSDASITSVEDLKGKSVTVPKASGQYLILGMALAQHGMTFDDIDYRPLPAGDGQAAFLSGKVDAIISSTNGTVLIQKNRPDTNVIFDPSTDFEAGGEQTFFSPDVIVATRAAIEEKPDAIRAFIKGHHESGIASLTDAATRDETIEAIMTYMTSVGAGNDDVNSTAETVDAMEWFTLEESAEIMNSDEFVAGLESQSQFWLEAGVIDELPDVDDVYTTDLLD